jgi:diketogulonate reductase-like aldo/keto reductase
LTGTTSETHMREDLASFEVNLTEDDVRTLERVER